MIAEKRDPRNAIIAFLTLLVIALIGALVYFEFINKNDNICDKETKQEEIIQKPTPSPKEEDLVEPSPIPQEDDTLNPSPSPIDTNTFIYSNRNYGLASSGVVTIKGYAEVKYKVRDCGVMGATCTEKEASSINDIVYFHITEVDNDEFKKALTEWGYEKMILNIGCLNNNLISYHTAADEFGPDKYEDEEQNAYKYFSKTIQLDKELSKKIVSSTEKKPITLKITKSKLSHYVSLDAQCDTPITGIEIDI